MGQQLVLYGGPTSGHVSLPMIALTFQAGHQVPCVATTGQTQQRSMRRCHVPRSRMTEKMPDFFFGGNFLALAILQHVVGPLPRQVNWESLHFSLQCKCVARAPGMSFCMGARIKPVSVASNNGNKRQVVDAAESCRMITSNYSPNSCQLSHWRGLSGLSSGLVEHRMTNTPPI
jgi:hypothetical protein